LRHRIAKENTEDKAFKIDVVTPAKNIFQTNGIDCGLFTCANAKEFVLTQQFFTPAYFARHFQSLWRPSYTASDIPGMRTSLGAAISRKQEEWEAAEILVDSKGL
jgi:Ulp1 family protease